MTAVDFAYLGAHFLWILGLSLLLAAFSYHVWRSQETARPLSDEFLEPSWRLAVNAGLLLIALSITVMPRAEPWWARLIALLFALTFTFFGVLRWRQLGVGELGK